MVSPLTLDEIRLAAGQLADRVVRTPVHRLQSPEVEQVLGATTETWLKLELFQRTGTFKARGALGNPLRVELCRSFGAEVVFAENAHAGFELAARLAEQEGRTTALGTATVGLELCEQIPGLDASTYARLIGDDSL